MNNIKKVSRKNLSNVLKESVFKKYDGKCCNCGSTYNTEYHHIVPLLYGGLDIDTNIVLLCKECHYKVHQKVYTKRTSSTRAKRPNAVSYKFAKPYIDSYVSGEISLDTLKEVLKCKAYKQTLRIPHIKEYIKELGISEEHFKRIIKNNASKHRAKTNIRRKVICNNEIFKSIAECSTAYMVNQSNMISWLKGKRPMPQRFQEMGLSYY